MPINSVCGISIKRIDDDLIILDDDDIVMQEYLARRRISRMSAPKIKVVVHVNNISFLITILFYFYFLIYGNPFL